MKECNASLGGAAAFSTLDANSGHWHIDNDEADRDKIVFTSHHGLYLFIRMPFGLRNVVGTFQPATDVILFTERRQVELVYLENILVFFESPQEQSSNAQTVHTLLRNAGVTLKIKLCRFFNKSIDYLGHEICFRRLEIVSITTEAKSRLKEPTNMTEL